MKSAQGAAKAMWPTFECFPHEALGQNNRQDRVPQGSSTSSSRATTVDTPNNSDQGIAMQENHPFRTYESIVYSM